MMRTLGAMAALTAGLFAATAASASAEKYDISTFTCRDLAEAMSSGSKDEQYGMSVILYWLAGYNATDEQGTVIYFSSLEKDFANTLEYCAKNPNIGVVTASAKFMGENASPSTGEPVDLSTLKCEKLAKTTKDDQEGLGQILMWLAGYHAYTNEDMIFDSAAFTKSATEIGDYCRDNSQVGFFTTAEKFMSAE
jgi:hypothetical protein